MFDHRLISLGLLHIGQISQQGLALLRAEREEGLIQQHRLGTFLAAAQDEFGATDAFCRGGMINQLPLFGRGP